jgi:cyclic pyranopterin monophosphate synthase
MSELSHIDEAGRAQMVDVSSKSITARVARASGSIRMRSDTMEAIRRGAIAKGDVLTVARIAGIQAAKRTSELIPLCHPIPLTNIEIDLTIDPALPGVRAEAISKTAAQTGVEMEAITAVAVALITIYDMAKAMDRGMLIGDIRLIEKTGGKEDYRADP